MDISAQVSLYPLTQNDLSQVKGRILGIFDDYRLDVLPGPMNILISGEDEAVFSALQAVFQYSSELGQVVILTTLSNTRPLHEIQEPKILFFAIGYVENQFNEPVPASEIRATESRIILKPEFSKGLQGFEHGQRIMVVYNFHRSDGFDLLQHPQGDRSRPKRGVFTLRSPKRPNPIGVTIVELVGVENNILHVKGLDAINGTPVLDIKPE